jgi:ribosomal protein S18 acetylase RimI-like enzyme
LTSEPASLISLLPLDRWQEFRDLRMRALQSDPAAFGQAWATANDYSDEVWKARLQDAQAGTSWLVFAEVSGRLAGMVGAFQSEQDRDRRAVTIWGMFVDRSARESGVGVSMLRALLDQLSVAGIVSARLAVNREQTAAVRLYQRAGFRIVGHETVTLGDGLLHDEYLMEVLIGAEQI